MSDCFGGDVCTRGGGGSGFDRYEWDMYFGGGDSGGGYDEGGGGGGGSGTTNNNNNQPVLQAHEIADLTAAFVKLKNAFQELLALDLKPLQKVKINKLINGVNDLVDLLNGGGQLTDHFINANLTAAAAEVLGFMAGFGVGFSIGASAPAALTVLASTLTGMAVEYMVGEALNTLRNTYNEYEEAYDPDWYQDFLCGTQVVGSCDYQMPPILLDLNGDGVVTVSRYDSPARIDIDNDGYLEKISWVSATDGILFIDHNGSGTIDNTNEFSFALFESHQATDLEGLRTFDTNGDSVFNNQDESYKLAGIWQDKNQNAKSEDGELMPLSAQNISFDLSGVVVSRYSDDVGIGYEMTYSKTDNSGAVTTHHAQDAIFYGDLRSGIKANDINDFTVINEWENGKIEVDMTRSTQKTTLRLTETGINGFELVDLILGSNKQDLIEIKSSHPTKIVAGKGKDIIEAGPGNNDILAGRGNDKILGGAGNDRISGQRGNDVIDGGDGNDILVGGKGKDNFILSKGHDRILDFTPGKDTIQLNGVDALTLSNIMDNLTESDEGVTIDYGNDGSTFLLGLTIDQMSTEDFSTTM